MDYQHTRPFIHIVRGNCIEMFPALTRYYSGRCIQLCGDPPYNIKFKGYDMYDDNLSDEEYIRLISTFRGLPAALIQYPENMGRWIVPALGPMRRSATWCYRDVSPRCTRQIGFFNVVPDFYQVRRPFSNPNDKRLKAKIEQGILDTFCFDWWDDIELLKANSRERRGSPHPCPVPIKLIERILALCAHKGDLVCDPFAGTLTTAIAAHRLGLDFIGVELSPQYIDFGVKRIQRELGVAPVVWDGLPNTLAVA